MALTNVGMIGNRVVKNVIRRCGTTGSTRSDPETHFGFERVKESQKGRKVYEVFENVSDKYDVMNDSMSLGLHRIWKDIFVARLAPTAGTELLDVAGGTGNTNRDLQRVKFSTQTRQKKIFFSTLDLRNFYVAILSLKIFKTAYNIRISIGYKDNFCQVFGINQIFFKTSIKQVSIFFRKVGF